MTNEEIKAALSALFPAVAYDETGEFLNVQINAPELRPVLEALRGREEFSCDYLFCLTCVDWKTHLTMVYHLLSKKHRHTLVLKAKIADVNAPQIAAVCDIWRTADFMEREVYDLFGVRFLNHPDMRRLLLDESWEGYPLRKNYADENMITL